MSQTESRSGTINVWLGNQHSYELATENGHLALIVELGFSVVDEQVLVLVNLPSAQKKLDIEKQILKI